MMRTMARRAPRHTPAGDHWFLAGYAGLAGFFALEATVRQPGSSAACTLPTTTRARRVGSSRHSLWVRPSRYCYGACRALAWRAGQHRRV